MQFKPFAVIAILFLVAVVLLMSGCTSTNNSSPSIAASSAPSLVTSPSPSPDIPTSRLPISSQTPQTNHLSIKIAQSPSRLSSFEQNDQVDVYFNSDRTFEIDWSSYGTSISGIYSINNNSISLVGGAAPEDLWFHQAIVLHQDGTCAIYAYPDDQYPAIGTYEWV